MKKRKIRTRTHRGTVRKLLATDDEWRAIDDSVAAAETKLLGRGNRPAKAARKTYTSPGLTQLLNLPAAQNALFSRLGAACDKQLDDGVAVNVLLRSAAENDTSFVVRLGKVLSPGRKRRMHKDPDALSNLLLRFWTQGTKRTFARYAARFPHPCEYTPLCFFKDRAITQFCCIDLRLVNPGGLPLEAVVDLNLSTVRKRIQRLGLVRGKKRIVKSYTRQGAKALLNQ